MARTSTLTSALSLVALGARSALADCVSYGMDFQNGKTYFQNSLSSDNFTFVSQFEGCQPDTAYNILVDPVGDQLLCTDTQLTPDNTDQLANCPVIKSSLTDGNWSIIIISNNGGAGEPIAYERDFTLTVGPQSTSTFTPTMTATVVSTPVVNSTTTTTSTLSSILAAVSVTSPSVTVTPTTTLTPSRITTTSTKNLFTVKLTSYSVKINPSTKTATASCKLPTKPTKFDPVARIRPTIGPLAYLFSDKVRREEVEQEKERFVEERAARLALVKRAPDPQPLVVTDSNTDDWPTTTSTSTAPAITATLTTEATTTTTITPSPVTVLKGKTTAARVTVTAPTPTKTVTRYTIATSTISKIVNAAFTLTVTTTPESVKAACTSAGGILY